MLTESEKQWLHERKLLPNPYCGWCMKYALCCSPLYNECPTKTADISDALEFSERVASKLARWDNEYHKDDHLCPYGDDDLDSYIPLCHCTDFCKGHPKLGCVSAKIAWARLAVEEEMDNG